MTGTTLVSMCREMQAVENLLTMMSSVVHRHKKQLQLRKMCSEERVWRSHLNHTMAQAHIALLYQGLDKLHGGAQQHRLIRYKKLLEVKFNNNNICCHNCYDLHIYISCIYMCVFMPIPVCIICAFHRYSQLNPLCFSLAYSGILIRRNSQRQQSSKQKLVSERDSCHSSLSDYVAAHKKGSKNIGEENGKI